MVHGCNLLASTTQRCVLAFALCIVLACAVSSVLAIVPQLHMPEANQDRGHEVDAAQVERFFPYAASVRKRARATNGLFRTTWLVVGDLPREDRHVFVPNKFVRGVVSSGGFPFKWLFWTATSPPSANSGARGGLLVHKYHSYHMDHAWLVGRAQLIVPTGILWRACLLNIAIWSSLSIAVTVLWRAICIRSRRRRGLCCRCRYPLGPGSACPECGMTDVCQPFAL